MRGYPSWAHVDIQLLSYECAWMSTYVWGVGTRAHTWYVHVLEIIACLCKSVYYYNLKSRRPKWMYRVMCTKIIPDCFSSCGKALQRRGRTEGSWVFWGLSVDL